MTQGNLLPKHPKQSDTHSSNRDRVAAQRMLAGIQRIKTAYVLTNETIDGNTVTMTLDDWQALEAAILQCEPSGLDCCIGLVIPSL